MSEHQQPKEYIITEYELDEIFAFLQNPPMFDIPEFTLEIEHQIRSRPAPQPQPPISTNGSLPEVEQIPDGSSRAPESGTRKGTSANDRQQEYIITEDDLDWFAHICDAYYLAALRKKGW